MGGFSNSRTVPAGRCAIATARQIGGANGAGGQLSCAIGMPVSRIRVSCCVCRGQGVTSTQDRLWSYAAQKVLVPMRTTVNTAGSCFRPPDAGLLARRKTDADQPLQQTADHQRVFGKRQVISMPDQRKITDRKCVLKCKTARAAICLLWQSATLGPGASLVGLIVWTGKTTICKPADRKRAGRRCQFGVAGDFKAVLCFLTKKMWDDDERHGAGCAPGGYPHGVGASAAW